jgi:hypothetical protein
MEKPVKPAATQPPQGAGQEPSGVEVVEEEAEYIKSTHELILKETGLGHKVRSSLFVTKFYSCNWNDVSCVR